MNAFKFDFPLNCNVIGGSNSGKSTWIQKVLDSPEVWAKPVDRIYYFYGIESEALKQIKKKHPDAFYHKGLPPSLEDGDMFDNQLNNLVVFDDLAQEIESSPNFTNFLVVSKSIEKEQCTVFRVFPLFSERNTSLEYCMLCVNTFPFCGCQTKTPSSP